MVERLRQGKPAEQVRLRQGEPVKQVRLRQGEPAEQVRQQQADPVLGEPKMVMKKRWQLLLA